MGLKLYVATESSTAFSEWHLQMIWREQRWFRPLMTTTGGCVEVITPGIWNKSSGPDFLYAHLIINGQPKRGHVELHLDAKSWVSHGHCYDKGYDETILHICLWPADSELKTYTCRKECVPLVVLAPFLTLPLDSLAELVETPKVLQTRPARYGRCHEKLFKSLSLEKSCELLEGAALVRLKQKWAKVKGFEGQQEHLTAAIALCLGLPKDQELFLKLYRWLVKEARSNLIEERYALCLGVCGFFQGSRPSSIDQTLWHKLEQIWCSLRSDERLPQALELSNRHSRPVHHPLRRLLALAYLSLDSANESLAERTKQLWALYLSNRKIKEFEKGLMALLTEYQLIEGAKGNPFLLGKSLRKEMVLNAFLPFLYSEVVQEEQLHLFLSMYRSISSPHYGVLDYLKRRFFGRSKKGSLLKKAIYAQAALQLHRDFCSSYESSCIGCPFVERCLCHKSLVGRPISFDR